MTDAREYLESFKKTEERIRLKARQIRELQDRLMCLSAPMENEQVSHTRNVAIMAETVAMIVDMQNELDQQTARLLQAKREAYRLFDQIQPQSAALLLDRYLEGSTVAEMSKKLFLSQRQTQRRLNESVLELQAVFDRLDAEKLSPDVM